MATIIPFPEIAKADRPAHSGGCHVLIFPGVRIERSTPPAPKAQRRASAKPRRKTQRSKRSA